MATGSANSNAWSAQGNYLSGSNSFVVRPPQLGDGTDEAGIHHKQNPDPNHTHAAEANQHGHAGVLCSHPQGSRYCSKHYHHYQDPTLDLPEQSCGSSTSFHYGAYTAPVGDSYFDSQFVAIDNMGEDFHATFTPPAVERYILDEQRHESVAVRLCNLGQVLAEEGGAEITHAETAQRAGRKVKSETKDAGHRKPRTIGGKAWSSKF